MTVVFSTQSLSAEWLLIKSVIGNYLGVPMWCLRRIGVVALHP